MTDGQKVAKIIHTILSDMKLTMLQENAVAKSTSGEYEPDNLIDAMAEVTKYQNDGDVNSLIGLYKILPSPFKSDGGTVNRYYVDGTEVARGVYFNGDRTIGQRHIVEHSPKVTQQPSNDTDKAIPAFITAYFESVDMEIPLDRDNSRGLPDTTLNKVQQHILLGEDKELRDLLSRYPVPQEDDIDLIEFTINMGYATTNGYFDFDNRPGIRTVKMRKSKLIKDYTPADHEKAGLNYRPEGWMPKSELELPEDAIEGKGRTPHINRGDELGSDFKEELNEFGDVVVPKGGVK